MATGAELRAEFDHILHAQESTPTPWPPKDVHAVLIAIAQEGIDLEDGCKGILGPAKGIRHKETRLG